MSDSRGFPSSMIEFFSFVSKLKKTKRTGWVNNGISDPESIADHMYRAAIMALVSPLPLGVDRDRCIRMALVHDLAESIVGDITPFDGIPDNEKHSMERHAMMVLGEFLDESVAIEINQLWEEYEQGQSPEAKYVKDIDKLEMLLQASEYEIDQNKQLDSFFESTLGKIKSECFAKIDAQLRKDRQK